MADQDPNHGGACVPRSRRVALGVWVAVALGLVVLTPRPVLGQSDEINTSGGGNIVADARRWWANPTGHSDEFRTRTRHCLELLDDAEQHRLAAQRYYDQARRTTDGVEAKRIRQRGMAEYETASRLVRRFYECARAPSDRISTGGGTRPAPRRPSYGGGDGGDTGRRPPRTPPREDGIDTGGTGGRGTPSGGSTRPRLPGGADRICDLQRLAAWVFQRYNSGHPIARVRVTNAASPTYLLLLSGVEFQSLRQANTWGQAFLGWANIQALDAYRMAIVDAVRDLPPGTNLIIAGHSQGGLEAQNVVGHLVRQLGHRVSMVIGYGAPVMPDREAGTGYLHVRAPDDPLPALDRRYALDPHEVVTSARGTRDPHQSYPWAASGLSQYRVPSVSVLRTPCYEIDLTTVREFEAPNLFTRFVGPLNPQQVARGSLNPESGLHGGDEDYNCFWVSLAQDRMWATGLPVPARCEAAPIRDGDIPPILRRQYAGRPLDDLHGPPGDGHDRHAQGEKVQSDPGRIARAMGSGQPEATGRRGLVFVRPPGRNVGHVFNVRNVGGRIEYWDEQRGFDPSPFFFVPGAEVFFYRTN